MRPEEVKPQNKVSDIDAGNVSDQLNQDTRVASTQSVPQKVVLATQRMEESEEIKPNGKVVENGVGNILDELNQDSSQASNKEVIVQSNDRVAKNE